MPHEVRSVPAVRIGRQCGFFSPRYVVIGGRGGLSLVNFGFMVSDDSGLGISLGFDWMRRAVNFLGPLLVQKLIASPCAAGFLLVSELAEKLFYFCGFWFEVQAPQAGGLISFCRVLFPADGGMSVLSYGQTLLRYKGTRSR